MLECPLTCSRRQTLGLLAMLAASTLSACAQSSTRRDQTQRGSPPAELPPTRVAVAASPASRPQGTLWVWQKKDFIPAFNAWFAQEMQRFCGQQNWALKISELEPAIFASAVAANDTADLVMHTLSLNDLSERNLLASVRHIVEQLEAQWGAAADSVAQDYQRDGDWWAVPYFLRSDGGWFLREPFEAAHVDMEQVRTYEALADACLEVSRPDLYGWGMTVNRCGDGEWFLRRIMHGWGAYLQDESGAFITMESPEMTAAMRWMTSIYQDEPWKPMLPPAVRNWDDSANNELFLSGKLGYTQNGGTIYGTAWLNHSPILEQMGYHVPCGGPANQEFNRLGANTFMMLRQSKHLAEAEEAILHFVHEPAIIDETFAQAPGFALPSYRDLWDASQTIPTLRVAMEQRRTALDSEAVRPGIWPGPDSPVLADLWRQGVIADMVKALLNGTAVEDAVATAQERGVALWQKAGLPGA